MPITISHADFKRLTKRNSLHWRSAELDRVLQCLQAHERNRNFQNIASLKNALGNWISQNPNEVANRNQNNIIHRLSVEIINEYQFLRQLQLANTRVQQLVNTRSAYVVNDADTTDANRPRLMASMLSQLQMTLRPDAGGAAMMANLGLRNRAHWENKGAAVANQPTMEIRCAESAALVVHTLRQDPNFNLPLSIIEQGRGSIDGHFWVVAGNITNRSGTPNFGEDTFAIDLWGRATRHTQRVIEGPPGRRPFNMANNTVRILMTWGHI